MACFDRYRGDGLKPDGTRAERYLEQSSYLADEDLVNAVNASMAVEMPLLVTGEAGTGKTMLADSVAAELGLELKIFSVRSDQQRGDLLYRFDHMKRFYDASIHSKEAEDLSNYIVYGVLADAIREDKRCVVLIDEIDKAPRDFPNDLLYELDQMELRVQELKWKPIRANHRPIVIITSNRESQLPDPFLRRVVFHHIEFPNEERLNMILKEHFRGEDLIEERRKAIVKRFTEIRNAYKYQKPPSTGELLAWARILYHERIPIKSLEGSLKNTPYVGALVKLREDLQRIRPSSN